MKTVFTSDEIAHIWVHDKHSSTGRSPGNASFNGNAFYSYGTVIARRIEYKGKTAYILDRASFSISTSKIQNRVACAIPKCEKVFSIHRGKREQSLDWTPQDLRDFYIEESKRVEDLPASRYMHKRAEQYTRATSLLCEARDVCEFFGLAFLALSQKIDKRNAQNDRAAEIIETAHKKREAGNLQREKKQAAEKLARNIAFAEKYIATGDEPMFSEFGVSSAAALTLPEPLREKFLAKAKLNNEAWLTRWRAGEDIRIPYDLPVMLRVERNEGSPIRAEMVTSKGARVYLDDAEKTFRFVSKLRAKGWHRNGETHAIGHYQLDAVNEQGVVAGCHRVSWEEIERFAKANGWTA